MIRRYKVSTIDLKRKVLGRKQNIVIAYDAKDAFAQVDLLIDKSIQYEEIQVASVEPYPFTFFEKIKMLFA